MEGTSFCRLISSYPPILPPCDKLSMIAIEILVIPCLADPCGTVVIYFLSAAAAVAGVLLVALGGAMVSLVVAAVSSWPLTSSLVGGLLLASLSSTTTGMARVGGALDTYINN